LVNLQSAYHKLSSLSPNFGRQGLLWRLSQPDHVPSPFQYLNTEYLNHVHILEQMTVNEAEPNNNLSWQIMNNFAIIL